MHASQIHHYRSKCPPAAASHVQPDTWRADEAVTIEDHHDCVPLQDPVCMSHPPLSPSFLSCTHPTIHDKPARYHRSQSRLGQWRKRKSAGATLQTPLLRLCRKLARWRWSQLRRRRRLPRLLTSRQRKLCMLSLQKEMGRLVRPALLLPRAALCAPMWRLRLTCEVQPRTSHHVCVFPHFMIVLLRAALPDSSPGHCSSPPAQASGLSFSHILSG